MELPSLDLNLLVALNALLVERNVTRAGDRIGLSQPATSAALGRLRRHFDDELLRRVGTHYELSPLASSLLEQSDVALRYVENTFAARPVFDARSSTRTFSIIASDYALIVIGEALARLLEERAPAVRLHIVNLARDLVDDVGNSMRLYDVMLLPKGYVSDLAEAPLFEDDWVVLAGCDSSWSEPLSSEDLSRARWVTIFDGPTQFTPPDKAMGLLGIDRRTDIVVESFAPVPFMIRGGNRLALVPRRLAANLAPSLGVRVFEAPVALPGLGEWVWWHPSRTSDPGHRWLVDLLGEAGAGVGPVPRPLRD